MQKLFFKPYLSKTLSIILLCLAFVGLAIGLPLGLIPEKENPRSEEIEVEISDESSWNDIAEYVASGEDSSMLKITIAGFAGNIASIGTPEHPFEGTVDGQGQTIRVTGGVGTSYCEYFYGPFGYTSSSAQISNLFIEYTGELYFISDSFWGGLIGYAGADFWNCTVFYNDALIYMDFVDCDRSAYWGGMIGYGPCPYIYSGEESTWGTSFVMSSSGSGDNELEVQITSDTNTERATYVGGIIGESTGRITNVRCALNWLVSVDAENYYIGRIAGSATTSGFSNVEAGLLNNGEIELFIGTGDPEVEEPEPEPEPQVGYAFSGSGTSSSPYLIKSKADLVGLASNVNAGLTEYSGKYFKQTANIDLSGEEWIPIGVTIGASKFYFFRGYYNGNNYKITGYNISNRESFGGVFGAVSGATLENIHVYDSYMEGPLDDCGGIVGYGTASTIIKNCVAQVTIKCIADSGYPDDYGQDIGGIAGDFNGTLENCISYATVKGITWVGGLCGESRGDIISCRFSGRVEGQTKVGGLSGNIWGDTNISKCIVDGYVEGVSNVGGFIGASSSSIILQVSDCAGTGNIYNSNNSNSGVFGGYILGTATFTNCSYICSGNNNLKFKGTASNTTISGCYIKMNQNKYYSSGDFSGWTIMNNMNSGFPLQNNLFAVAIGGYTHSEVVADLKSKGFSLYS